MEYKKFEEITKEEIKNKESVFNKNVAGLYGKVYVSANDLLFFKDIYVLQCLNGIKDKLKDEDIEFICNSIKRGKTYKLLFDKNNGFFFESDDESIKEIYHDNIEEAFILHKNTTYDTKDIVNRFKNILELKSYTDEIQYNNIIEFCISMGRIAGGREPNVIFIYEDSLEKFLLESLKDDKRINLKFNIININNLVDEINKNNEEVSFILNCPIIAEKYLKDIKRELITTLYFTNSYRNYYICATIDEHINRIQKTNSSGFIDSIIKII